MLDCVLKRPVYPSHHNISIHILQTVLYTFLKVLTREFV